jgi:hypothetical protein
MECSSGAKTVTSPEAGFSTASHEQAARAISVRDEPDCERHPAGPEKGCRDNHADLERVEAQQGQVIRKQKTDVAIAKGAHAARPEQDPRIVQRARRQQAR